MGLPIIASVTPDGGPTTGGTEVTILGANFAPETGILFGDILPTNLEVINEGVIRATAPVQEAGEVPIVLVQADGVAVEMEFSFTYLEPDAAPLPPPPTPLTIESINPTRGPVDGGSRVTLRGTGFMDETGVLFGDAPATDVTVYNEGILAATAPAHDQGVVTVTVTTPDDREALAEASFTYYFDADLDGDGLTDLQETDGWDIWVDYFGIGLGTDTYGNFPGLHSVTSDPTNPDTDGDGLSDHEEYLIVSDPRKADTDEDGLADAEEVNRWLTSPISVDTDGDSRGPGGALVPNASLFDGAELGIDFDNDPSHTPARDATSPKLADTDGDGRTDWEEFDHPWRSPVIADLPAVKLEVVDDIDIRLDIEYAEEQGQTTEFGHTISEGTQQTQSTSHANTWGVTLGLSAMVGSEGATGFPCCNEAKFKTEITLSAETSYAHEWTTGSETAETFQEENSEMEGKSLTHTETAATGSISTGITLTNTGPVSYHLTNLGMTVRRFERAFDPDDPLVTGSYKTLATLIPALGDGVTLAPGQSTPVIQVEAQEINADRIKDFMRAPDKLHLEEAYFDLVTEDGVNYAFLNEVTQARTATIVLDFSDGESYRYRIATNVNRSADSRYAGLRMADALDLLGVEIRTAMQFDDSDPSNPIPIRRALTQIRNQEGVWLPDVDDPYEIDQYEFWLTSGNSDDFADDDLDFENIVLQAGDTAFLVLARDTDEDGLYAWDEEQYGTSDDPNDPAPLDFDGDGLTDLEEASLHQVDDTQCSEPPCFKSAGWDVQIVGQDSYHVFSDPRNADADEDGLNDLEERNGADTFPPGDPSDTGDATDPNKADTDEDGLPDADDPAPLVPAVKLYVEQNGSGADGLAWDTAYTSIWAALVEAKTRNDPGGDPTDDVVEVWVAAGTYEPTETLWMLDSVALYGGFVGEETRRGQRNPNPMTNGTVIRGVQVSGGTALTARASGVVIDGLTISECTGSSAIAIGPSPAYPQPVEVTLRNLYLVDNESEGLSGAAASISAVFGDCDVNFEECVFSNNRATYASGGALAIAALPGGAAATVRLSKCQLIDNRVEGNDYNGGAIACLFATLSLDACEFFGNSTGHGHGGAIASWNSTVSIDACNFDTNRAKRDGAWLYVEGGAIRHEGGSLRVTNSRFARNEAENAATLPSYAHGGAVWVRGPADLAIVNCAFWRNEVDSEGMATYRQGSGLYLESVENGCLTNCTVVENKGWEGAIHCDSCVDMTLQNCIVAFNNGLNELSGGSFSLTHCCVYPGGYSGFPVLNVDPGFPEDWEDTGDLHPGAGSPCIDYGNSFVDTDLVEPGPQYLPLIDLDGIHRFFDGDGDGDGEATVDLGAYEYQGGNIPDE